MILGGGLLEPGASMRSGLRCLCVLLLSPALAWAQADAGVVEPVDAGLVEVVDAGVSEVAPVEAFTPSPEAFTASPVLAQFDEAPRGPEVRFFAQASALAGLDTRFESPPKAELGENVAELAFRARVGADVKLTPSLRAYVEGRFWVRGTTQRDFDRAKALVEPQLGEAFLDWYTPKADVRLGAQRLVLGESPLLSPLDVLNPRELRDSFLFADPDFASRPVFAVKATGEVGSVSWLAAYVPFFVPSSYALVGQDEALLQPALAPAIPFRRVDAQVEDLLWPRLMETSRPPPLAGDVALSVAWKGPVTIRGTWAWVNEKLPQVTIDKDLQRLLEQQNSGMQVDPALALSVQSRLQAGETLMTGRYLRQHLFGLSGSALLGPGQLDVDLTYSPRQTFFDLDFSPRNQGVFSWVATYAIAEDSPWQWSATYFGMAVPLVAERTTLALVEPPTAVGAARTAWFHLLVAMVGRSFFDDRLDVSVRGAFEVVQRSFVLSPRVAWKGFEHFELWAGAEFYEGPKTSPFGYFGRNDRVLLGAVWTPF